MKTQLVLSLFPGIGLMDMAFEEHGFCVVRGPDALWGGDIRTFEPPANRFDGVIGGPPCQAFSRLRHLVEHNGYNTAEDLIPEYVRCVRAAQPHWFIMENVEGAPCPYVPGWGCDEVVFNNRLFGGVQHRRRRLTIGVRGVPHAHANWWKWIEIEALQSVEWAPAVCAGGVSKPGIPTDNKKRAKFLGHKSAGALCEALRLQGLPENFLDDVPFTLSGKFRVVGNGLPLPMGRAVARAVRLLIENTKEVE